MADRVGTGTEEMVDTTVLTLAVAECAVLRAPGDKHQEQVQLPMHLALVGHDRELCQGLGRG